MFICEASVLLKAFLFEFTATGIMQNAGGECVVTLTVLRAALLSC